MDAGARGEVIDESAPVWVRVTLARGAVQVIADDAGVDLLHIKGDVVDPRLRPSVEPGSDVDALVRSEHIERLDAALRSHGWRVFSTFDLGSPFGHAQTYVHGLWGFFDLHRSFPGIRLEPAAAFELIWERRQARALPGARGWVPSLAMQATVLMLNAARSPDAEPDPVRRWIVEPELDPDEVAACVEALDARVAFAAATGDLEDFRSEPEYTLWRAVTQNGSRASEWWGRVRAAGSPRGALRIATRAPLVNVEQLRHDLGRDPSSRDIVVAFGSRLVRGVRELGSRPGRQGAP
jgi:hypothetical protein